MEATNKREWVQYPITSARYLPNCPDNSGWKKRHETAMWTHPVGKMIRAWVDYAERHAQTYAANIGDDYVLGSEWVTMGVAMRGLLNGECGHLDCGTLDHIILANLKEQGFNETGERVAND